MDGEKFAQWIELQLKEKGIGKGEFYKAVGITATALYGWKRGSEPKKETVRAIEDYLGESFDQGLSGMTEEEAELLQSIRERSDLKVLFRSARGVPPSSVYEIVARLEKMKESAD